VTTGSPLAGILYIGTLPPHPGGTAVSAFQLLLALSRRGHAVRCLSPVTPGARLSALRFDSEHPTLSVSRYEISRFDLGEPSVAEPDHVALERRAVHERVPELIAIHRPAIVMAGRESFGGEVPLIARRHGIPSVLLLRGGASTARLLAGDEPPERVREVVRRFGVAQRVIAVSDHLATGFARLGLTGIEVIPNHVDLERFAPRPADPRLLASLAIAPGSIVVAFVAALKRRKRPLDVVESAVTAMRRDPRLVYVVVGDGPQRPAMERLCADRHLTDRFRFVGWVDYERMPTYLSLADLVVMPSEAEGMARVYLEAQASGRTLVASDIPPARETVRHGETGLLFPLGDVEAFAARIVEAAADAPLRAHIGARARERARIHDLESVAEAYSAVIEEVAAGWPQSGAGGPGEPSRQADRAG
jgi:glycosyltransferase involved in cell wall biosynthesis